MEERWERARAERMTVQSADPDQPWTDYTVSEQDLRQDLSRRRARTRAGRVVLLVSRLPHEHTRDVQAHPARACEAEAAVHGRAIEAAVQTQDDQRSRAVRRHSGVAAASAREARPGGCQSRSESCAAATSTTCRTCSSGSSIWNGAGGQSTSTRMRKNSSSGGSCSTASRAASPRFAGSRSRTLCAANCSRPSCCPINSTASRSPRAPAAPFSPTTWGSARPSRPSACRSSSRAKRAYRRCSSSAPHR